MFDFSSGGMTFSVERLARRKEAQDEIEILSQAEIPFIDVSRLAKSAKVGVAALGLAAIVRRDDIPAEWTTEALRRTQTDVLRGQMIQSEVVMPPQGTRTFRAREWS